MRPSLSMTAISVATILSIGGCAPSAAPADSGVYADRAEGGSMDAREPEAGMAEAGPSDVRVTDAVSADLGGEAGCTPPTERTSLGLPGPPMVVTGSDPSTVARPSLHSLVDLDGDCRLDLVVADEAGSRVVVARGLDGARFAQPIALDVAGRPRAVTTGDVDGDGVPDLLVAVPANGTVLLVRTRRPLAFETPHPIAVGGAPVALAAGDLDGDGRTDVAVMAADYSRYGHEEASASVALLRNESGRLVARPAAWSWTGVFGAHSSWLRLGDLDGDGRPDLVASGPCPVTFVRNVGAASFAQGARLDGASGEPVLADFDGDGRVDIAATVGSGVGVFRNVGNGAFTSPTVTGLQWEIGSIASGDFDRDGHADLAVSALGTSEPTPTPQSTTLLLGVGDGSFVARPSIRTGGGEGFAAALLSGDLNRDGTSDLMAVHGGAGVAAPLMGDGLGRLVAPEEVLAAERVVWLATGDLDGDGDPDVVVSRATVHGMSATASLDVLRNDGGVLGRPTAHPLGPFTVGVGEVVLGDLDGDRRLDAIVALGGTDRIAVLRGRGDGDFVAPVELATSDAPDPVALGDLDRDGDLDAVVGTASGLDVFMNAGGVLGGRTTYAGGAHLWRGALALADLDGDGDREVVAVAVDGPGRTRLVVRLNSGDGRFGDPSSREVGATWGPLTAGDLDEDGDVDIAIAEGDGVEPGSVRVAINVGGGRFDDALVRVGMQPAAVRIADVDLDGRQDIVVANSTGNGLAPSIGVLAGRPDGTFAPQTPFPVAGGVGAFVLADLDRDGRLDVLAASPRGDGTVIATLRSRRW